MSAHPPVLLYHRISDRPLLAGTWVTPASLAAHLDVLLRAGFQPLSAQAWLEARAGAARNRFLVTFDDGTEDLFQYRHMLLERGVPAVVFVPSALLGRANRWDWPFPGRSARHLDWDALCELIAEGWEVGLHGATHRDLTRVGVDQLAAELAHGRASLEAGLGCDVRLLAYPFGRVDTRVATAANRAGFQCAFVVSHAPPEVPGVLAVRRRPVYCLDTPRAILTKVADPAGRTLRGRWELKKERMAHAVGRWSAGILDRRLAAQS